MCAMYRIATPAGHHPQPFALFGDSQAWSCAPRAVWLVVCVSCVAVSRLCEGRCMEGTCREPTQLSRHHNRTSGGTTRQPILGVIIQGHVAASILDLLTVFS